ncbi:MAG: methyltransferase domain-containing protein [Cytophagales bacterium]|nr:methyltransferase domain-containing protein [Armatimonadota bacterium]
MRQPPPPSAPAGRQGRAQEARETERRYDNVADVVFLSVNMPVLECIPAGVRRVLDLGCGAGTLGACIKEQHGCEVVGVTIGPEEGALAASVLDRVVIADLRDYDFRELGSFDCVVCSGVLGYLQNPAVVLDKIHDCLTPDGVLVAAIPNILQLKQRLEFLRGRFRYAQGKVLDKFSVRFYDRQTAAELLEDAEFGIIRRFSRGYIPLPGIRRLLGPTAGKIDQAVANRMPGLFATQFYFVAQSQRSPKR